MYFCVFGVVTEARSMSMKLRASSGTYNVRASEQARDFKAVKTVRCVVHFLDDTEVILDIDVSLPIKNKKAIYYLS